MLAPDFVRKSLYLLSAIWILLAIIFGIYDLQISQALVNRQSGWARWIEIYGEMPGIVIMIVALYVAYSQRRRRAEKIKEYTLSFLTIVATSFALYLLLGWALFRYFPELVKTHASILFAVLLVLLTVQRCLTKTPGTYPASWVKASFLTIQLALINVVLFVQGLKSFWGRVRFRDLQPDYSNFTPWYLPGAGGGESFPSGHTALAWMLLPLILLAVPYGKKATTVVTVMVFGWGFLVAAGRVTIGAHYASDTLFATGVALLCFLWSCRRNEQ